MIFVCANQWFLSVLQKKKRFKKKKIIEFEFLVIEILFICCLFVRISKYGCEPLKYNNCSKNECCFLLYK